MYDKFYLQYSTVYNVAILLYISSQEEHQHHELGIQLSKFNTEMERIRSKLAATFSELQTCRSEVERERATHLQQLDELSSNFAQRDTSAQTHLQNSLQALRSEHEAEIGNACNIQMPKNLNLFFIFHYTSTNYCIYQKGL